MNLIVLTQCFFLGFAVMLGVTAIDESPKFLINEEQAKALNKPASSAQDLKQERNAQILEAGFWAFIVGIAILMFFVR